MSKRDYYEVLGLQKGAGKEEIKKAYRKLAMQFHPDRNPGNKESENKFKEASEAADVLLNDDKRTRYDQFGHAGVDGMGGGGGFGGGQGGDFADLGDIFGDIFGDILGGGRRRGGRSRGRPGHDLQMEVQIDFKEAAFGAEKEISYQKLMACDTCHGTGGKDGAHPVNCDMCRGLGEIRRQQGFFTMASACPKCQGSGQMVSDPCGTCHGEGRKRKKVNLAVRVPAGIDSEQRLKLSGEGDAGMGGGPAGDLYVMINIGQHEFFEREGFDVLCTVPISFSQAALGSDIEVPTMEGKVEVKVASGTQAGKRLRLKGKGIQRLGGHGRGDQIINIHVETPTKLTSEQKDLLEKLAKFDTGPSHPMGKGFLDKFKDIFQ